MKKLFYIALVCCCLTKASGQSLRAYEKAGDACLRKADPLSAIDYYRQALEYTESGELFHKMAVAYLQLSEYKQALTWDLEAFKRSNEDEAWRNEAVLQLTDIYKRLGRFQEAEKMLQSLKLVSKLDSLNHSDWKTGIEEARLLANDTVPYRLLHLGEEINSVYSDFAPTSLNDSVLLFSSQREGGKKKGFAKEAALFTSAYKDSAYRTAQLFRIGKLAGKSIANASVSPDGKLMVFTACAENEQGIFICHLYESGQKNGIWQTPVELKNGINGPDFSSTQPAIASNFAAGYILYFSSNRPESLGGYDLYMSKRDAGGKYDSIQALASLNTRWNEMSPFYDALSDSMYFSSDRPGSLGGYDLYVCTGRNPFSQLKHLPGPFNSAYNDLYYHRSNFSSRTSWLVSNRPPARSISGEACCYDIFQVIKKEEVVQADSVLLTSDTANSVTPDSFQLAVLRTIGAEQIQAKVDVILPLRLYFDNDIPDPHTRQTTTKTRYDILAEHYLLKQADYLREWKDDRSVSAEITRFFDDSLSVNNQKLEYFSRSLLALLEKGINITIDVRGCASPLADQSYNLNLSRRRINSLLNYWLVWNEGQMQQFIRQGQLLINQLPAGESLAAGTVSDQLGDKARSVYSVQAALERRIEVIGIHLSK